MAYFKDFKSKYFDVNKKVVADENEVESVEKTLALADTKIEGMFEKAKHIQGFNLIYEKLDACRLDETLEADISSDLAVFKNMFRERSFDFSMNDGSMGWHNISIRPSLESSCGFSVRCNGHVFIDPDFCYFIIEDFIEEYDTVEKCFLDYVREYIDLVEKEKSSLYEKTQTQILKM